MLKAYGYWDAEIEANLNLARQELAANPGLFELGKAEFEAHTNMLLAKYPASTPIKDIPELDTRKNWVVDCASTATVGQCQRLVGLSARI